ncbi:hypothetical protein BDZ89DRAFT_1070165 [Hymenopellis radicata]|nr:hypothetical protein BDZ89DRAFT_1070165 [Hymenopellis radicata]
MENSAHFEVQNAKNGTKGTVDGLASPARHGFWEKITVSNVPEASHFYHKSVSIQTRLVGACGACGINELTTSGGLNAKNEAVEMRTAWTASPARLGFRGGKLSLICSE